MDALRKTKNQLKEEIGLEFIHNEQLVAAYTNVQKHIKFLLRQPGVQDAIKFPNSIMVLYDYLDEFRFLSWSSLYTGETSVQLKLVEPNNLLSLVLKLGKFSICKINLCLDSISAPPSSLSPVFIRQRSMDSFLNRSW